MKAFLIPSLCTAFLGTLTGAENETKPWDKVIFSVPLDKDAANVMAEGIDKLKKVQIQFLLSGKTVSVPAEELEGIDSPRLHTAQLLLGADYYGPVSENEELVPHYIVQLEYGKESEFGGYTVVQFLFHSGSYQERIVAVRVSPQMWTETRKFPGEEPIETGTITRPPE